MVSVLPDQDQEQERSDLWQFQLDGHELSLRFPDAGGGSAIFSDQCTFLETLTSESLVQQTKEE